MIAAVWCVKRFWKKSPPRSSPIWKLNSCCLPWQAARKRNRQKPTKLFSPVRRPSPSGRPFCEVIPPACNDIGELIWPRLPASRCCMCRCARRRCASIAAARALQQQIRELLGRLPRLGMLRETCQLLQVARAMEKDHPQGAGAVTEFDRLFEIGYKVDCRKFGGIVAGVGRQTAEGRKQKAEQHPFTRSPLHPSSCRTAADAQLIDCLQQVTESLLSEWLAHSRTLRLSVLERRGFAQSLGRTW